MDRSRASSNPRDDIQIAVRTLRARVTAAQSNSKIEVDAAALKTLLAAIENNKLIELADEISPQEAAEILRMSRPSVMRLIAQGILHPRKVLSRNKLSRAEVEAYKTKHTLEQQRALENLTSLVEEFDF